MLSPKCIALLEQLVREMDSEGAFFAMVTLGGDHDLMYSGNVPFDYGARLMREWLGCSENPSLVNVQHVGEMCGLPN